MKHRAIPQRPTYRDLTGNSIINGWTPVHSKDEPTGCFLWVRLVPATMNIYKLIVQCSIALNV